MYQTLSLNSKKWTMICLLLIAFGTLLSDSGFVIVAEAQQAKILLYSVNNKNSSNAFLLNPDVLKEISEMEPPIRVVAAVGNARVGKSTFLNLFSSILSLEGKSDAIEEVFKSGASLDPVTRGVWAHIIKHPDKNGSILLLDVEGTDLGNDYVTDRLSMFTAMLSSGLNIFALQVVKNGDINFLYRIVRLSELVFEGRDIPKIFPKLRIVLRTNLDVPDDVSLEYKIRQKIFHPDEQSMGKEKTIEKYFPKDRCSVSHIPSVDNPSELFRDIKRLRESSAWNSFEKLVHKMKDSPVKYSSGGPPIDGKTFRVLTTKLVEAMNSANDSWKDFGDVYAAVETYICTRRYEEYIKPVLLQQTSREMEDNMSKALHKFEQECSLPSEREKVKEELKSTLEEKRKREEEVRRQEEWSRSEERRWEEERTRLNEEKRRLEEEKRRLEEEKRRREEQENWWEYAKSVAKYFAPFLAGALFFSDEDLKDNVTTLSCSEFNDIGLRGVCWKWNENAQKTYGLTGEDCGVIAQEVKVLYPWAVAEGTDGYLRVHYGILHEMINVAHNNRNSSRLF